jgi:hypothetical protein
VIAVLDEVPGQVEVGERLALELHVVNDRRDPVPDLVVQVTSRWAAGSDEPVLRTGWRGAVDADAVARVGSLRIRVPAPADPAGASLETVVELLEGEEVLSRRVTRTFVTPGPMTDDR